MKTRLEWTLLRWRAPRRGTNTKKKTTNAKEIAEKYPVGETDIVERKMTNKRRSFVDGE